MVPVFNKGEKELSEHYRGMPLIATGYRIYAKLLKNELAEKLEKEQFTG